MRAANFAAHRMGYELGFGVAAIGGALAALFAVSFGLLNRRLGVERK